MISGSLVIDMKYKITLVQLGLWMLMLLSFVQLAGCNLSAKNDSTGASDTGIPNTSPTGTPPPPPPPDKKKVEEVFLLAKDFAQGNTSAALLADKFNKLVVADLIDLGKQTEGEHRFISYLVTGRASAETAAIINKFFSEIGPTDIKTQLDTSVAGQNALDILTGARPALEKADDRNMVLATILSFDTARALDWAMNNKPGTPGFAAIYGKVKDSAQEQIRNGLLVKAFAGGKAALKDLIKDSNSGGLKLLTDVYTLPNKAGTGDFKGSLLNVVMRRMADDLTVTLAGSGRTKAELSDMREISGSVKAILGANYADHVMTAENDQTDGIKRTIIAGLPAQPPRVDFSKGSALYGLSLDDDSIKVGDVLVEAAYLRPKGNTEILDWLYAMKIKTPADAFELANLALRGDEFIHHLVKLEAKAATNKMLDDFLTKVELNNPGDASKLVKRYGLSGLAIKILLAGSRMILGEDKGERQAMIVRLLKDGKAQLTQLIDALDLHDLFDAIVAKAHTADLKEAFAEASDKEAVGRWAAFNRARNIANSGGGTTDILDIFMEEYNRAAPVGVLLSQRQKKLRDALFAEVYTDGLGNTGNLVNDVAAGVKAVADLIASPKLSEKLLRANGYMGAITASPLYNVLVEAENSLAFAAGGHKLTQAIVQSIAGPLKLRFTGPTAAQDWKDYLDRPNVQGTPSAIEKDFIRGNAGDEATSKAWLYYN